MWGRSARERGPAHGVAERGVPTDDRLGTHVAVDKGFGKADAHKPAQSGLDVGKAEAGELGNNRGIGPRGWDKKRGDVATGVPVW